jgi:hypothetical protein
MFNEYDNGIKKVLGIFFMVVTSMKNDKRNLVLFGFRFNEYEKKKCLESIFMVVTSMKKATDETQGHLTLFLESATNDPNNTLNIFHGFVRLEKR